MVRGHIRDGECSLPADISWTGPSPQTKTGSLSSFSFQQTGVLLWQGQVLALRESVVQGFPELRGRWSVGCWAPQGEIATYPTPSDVDFVFPLITPLTLGNRHLTWNPNTSLIAVTV